MIPLCGNFRSNKIFRIKRFARLTPPNSLRKGSRLPYDPTMVKFAPAPSLVMWAAIESKPDWAFFTFPYATPL